MITRKVCLRSASLSSLRKTPYTCDHARYVHAQTSAAQQSIPDPTPFVPDPSTFLRLIGRNLSQHSAKIPNWQSLFSLTSDQLRELGIEPARTRRYLLWWRDRFRKGVFGIGGDLRHVKDGEAEIRVVELPVPEVTKSRTRKPLGEDLEAILPRMRRMVVNEPPEVISERKPNAYDLKPVEGMKIRGNRTVVGPFIQPVKGTNGSMAKIKVQEGMWEVKRGEKVDGGERRKKMVRRKRTLEQRRTGRV